MRPLLIVLLFLAGCRCDERLVPSSDCGKRCYPGDTEPVGACAYGRWACEDDGGITCEGAVMPMPEQCNGQDDDCDGKVDNRIWDDPHLCSTECGVGVEQCLSGRWAPCSAPKPKPEVCNSYDDDCDGKVDEAEPLPDGGFELTACFDGKPPANPFFLPCRPGVLRCQFGQQVCSGQVLPQPEICDSLDNDCDGEIDEGAPKIERADIVLIFDNSCSMSDVATDLKIAAAAWVAKYQPDAGGVHDLRFALVAAPHTDVSMYRCTPQLVTNFVDAAGIQAALALQNGFSGSGEEATLSAISDIIAPSNPFGLQWRMGAKRVTVVFSDEDPQAYDSDCLWQTTWTVEPQVLTSLMGGGVVLHVFTRASSWTEWRTFATAGGGQVWDIAGTTAAMEMQLDSIIQGATCGP